MTHTPPALTQEGQKEAGVTLGVWPRTPLSQAPGPALSSRSDAARLLCALGLPPHPHPQDGVAQPGAHLQTQSAHWQLAVLLPRRWSRAKTSGRVCSEQFFSLFLEFLSN